MVTVQLDKFCRQLQLEVITDAGMGEFDLISASANRPGLLLSGYFDYFSKGLIQVLGKSEISYLAGGMDQRRRREILERFFGLDFPVLIVCRDLPVPEDLIAIAQKARKPVLRTREMTARFLQRVMMHCDHLLAPRITEHGVLVDVYGVGIMLMGDSGIGKSETALELVKRGHRLVADDVVDIMRVSDNRLVGMAPPVTRHFMEIRGIGIVNIEAMYGISAVIDSKSIDIVISLEMWQQNKNYDRLGLVDDTVKILDVEVPNLLIPVHPGRQIAIIVEVAARNYRLKASGYHAAREMVESRVPQMMNLNEGIDHN